MLSAECKKYVFCKRNLILLLLLTVAFAGLVLFGEGGYIFGMAAEDREAFFKNIGGEFNDQTKILLENEKNALEEDMYITDADGNVSFNEDMISLSGKYGNTKMDDYSLLKSALNCIAVVEKRNKNIDIILSSDSNGSGNYHAEDSDYLVDREKITCLLGNSYFGWFAIILSIFIMASSFSIEYESRLFPVLALTNKGELSVILNKFITGIYVSLFANLYFFGLYILLQKIYLKLSLTDLRLPAFLAEDFDLAASDFTVWRILLAKEVITILLTVFLVCLAMAFSISIKKSVYAAIGVFFVYIAGTFIDLLKLSIYSNFAVSEVRQFQIFSEVTFQNLYELEKQYNPFALVDAAYYFQQPRVSTIFGIQKDVIIIPISLVILGIGVLTVFFLRDRRKLC